MMAVKVAINGLGRIGRCVARIIADRDDIELVAVNASGKEEMSTLLRTGQRRYSDICDWRECRCVCRRTCRSGATNLVPTTTGAAKAIAKVLPNLAGRLNGQAVRVPTADVSMVDLTVTLNQSVTEEVVKAAFKIAAEGSHKGILGVDEEYRVSQDFVGEELSTVVPLDTIQVIGEKMVKVLSWYDNEWGYSCRLVDMAVHISKK